MSATPVFRRRPIRLASAKETLENPGLAVKIVDVVGAPIEKALALLPPNWRDVVQGVTNKALMAALEAAVATWTTRRGGLRQILIHKALCAGLGRLSAAVFGLATLPVELPRVDRPDVSVDRRYRPQRRRGYQVYRDQAGLPGGLRLRRGGGFRRRFETGYFAVRTVLAREVSEAAKFIAEKGSWKRLRSWRDWSPPSRPGSAPRSRTRSPPNRASRGSGWRRLSEHGVP